MENLTNEQKLKCLKTQCTKLYARMKDAETIYVSERDEWRMWKGQYETLDRAMAEVDGRVQVIKRGGPKPVKEVGPATLTQAQIMEIAAKLGIHVDIIVET